jgi:hypothetical protein
MDGQRTAVPKRKIKPHNEISRKNSLKKEFALCLHIKIY